MFTIFLLGLVHRRELAEFSIGEIFEGEVIHGEAGVRAEPRMRTRGRESGLGQPQRVLTRGRRVCPEVTRRDEADPQLSQPVPGGGRGQNLQALCTQGW